MTDERPLEGYTYVIQAESGGPVKIGRAVNIGKRLSILQVGHPHKLRIVCLIPRDAEYRLHHLCYAYRLRGEWYNSTPQFWEILIGELGPVVEACLCKEDRRQLDKYRRIINDLMAARAAHVAAGGGAVSAKSLRARTNGLLLNPPSPSTIEGGGR